METKICSKCGRELPIDEFYKHPTMADGYFNVCKKCKKEYYEKNKEKNKEKIKEYYQKNKTKITKKHNEYDKTPMGRACHLVWMYKKMDRHNGFGDAIDFNAKWMVDNIFSKPCAHCGETDWRKLGCNRLDNSKPHTKDNVESCCWECGRRQPRK